MDHLARNYALLLREGGDQGVLTKEIDDSWDTTGRRVNFLYHLIGKE
jgi:hypothetical protein